MTNPNALSESRPRAERKRLTFFERYLSLPVPVWMIAGAPFRFGPRLSPVPCSLVPIPCPLLSPSLTALRGCPYNR